MKRVNITLFVLLCISIVFSCTKANLNYTQNGNWVSRASYGGINAIGIGFAASFVVGNNAYVGTGLNPTAPGTRLVSIFEYTPGAIPKVTGGYDSAAAAGTWTAVANFPGQPRSNAIGFTIGNIGYIGSGLANDGVTTLADFYSFDPSSGQWTQIDSIHDASGSYPRYDAAAFGFDTVGYVLTGTDGFNYFSDVWKYSPSAGHWISQSHEPGSTRSGAITWIYKGKGYLVTGYTPNTNPRYANANSAIDFWSFNPNAADSNNAWSRLHDIFNTNSGTFDDGYTNIVRKNGAGFVILNTANGDKGYVTLGSTNNTDITFTWEYDFASDVWTEKTPYEGTAREGAAGFTVQNRGFVAAGLNKGSQAAYTDCEEFFPNQVYNQFD
jgi:hypothetical protein